MYKLYPPKSLLFALGLMPMRLTKMSLILVRRIVMSLILAGCTPVAAPTAASDPAHTEMAAATTTTTLNVFAAASLTNAFSEMGENFVATYPDAAIAFNFAGSNQLATQIGEGAPADVFASANEAQMSVVISTGRILTATQQTFARNRLVVVAPHDNPAGLTTLQDLTTPGVKLVLAATQVPVGQYSLDFLDKAEASGSLGTGYKEAVMANIVSYEQNVRAVLTKVTLGEADAGIVYTSDVGAAADAVVQIEIPDSLNSTARYPIAPLVDNPHPALAQQFIAYVLGPSGQQILTAHGFVSIEGK